MNKNLTAFLTMIAKSEGTEHIGTQHGYNVIVGGGTFIGYKDHPRQLIDLPRLKIKSTAAGRYQILSRYYDHYNSVFKFLILDFREAHSIKPYSHD